MMGSIACAMRIYTLLYNVHSFKYQILLKNKSRRNKFSGFHLVICATLPPEENEMNDGKSGRQTDGDSPCAAFPWDCLMNRQTQIALVL